MKQHDDDAAPPQSLRQRRRPGARRPVWPFTTGSLTPHGGTDNEVAPAPAAEPQGVDPAAPGTLSQRRKP